MLGFSFRAILLCSFVGAFVGISLFTFVYAKGYSYLSSSPEACANCHVMRQQYEGWQKSSHHAVAVCVDCHLPHSFFGKYWVKAEDGFLHSLKFTLQNYPDHIQIRESNRRVANEACMKCHQQLAGTIAHEGSEKAEPGFCTHCHGNVGH